MRTKTNALSLMCLYALLLAPMLCAQVPPFGGGHGGTNQNFNPIGSGALASRPATCSVGQVWVCTGAGCTAANNVHLCTAPNTWTVQGTAAAAGVNTFAARNGDVVPQAGDYSAAQVTNTPAGSIAATTVQAAINELDSEKQPVVNPSLANGAARFDASGVLQKVAGNPTDCVLVDGTSGACGVGGGATSTSGLSDLKATMTSATQLDVAAGVARVGNTTYSKAAATLSFASSTGTGIGYAYVSDSGVIVIEYPSTVTLTSPVHTNLISTQLASPAVPANAIPLAEITFNNGITAVADKRGMMSSQPLVAGSGVSIVSSAGVPVIGIDTATVPTLGGNNVYVGGQDASSATLTAPHRLAAADPATCDPSKRETYRNTSTNKVRVCTATNTWSDEPSTGGGAGVVTGTGAPAAAACDSAGEVGSLYAQTDGAAEGTTLWVCGTRAAGGFGWDRASLDADLRAISLNTNGGFPTRSGEGAWAFRGFAAGAGLSITNFDGIAGTPTYSLNVNGLTEDTTPDLANDFVPTYDTSAAGHKKVKLSAIAGAGSHTQNTDTGTTQTSFQIDSTNSGPRVKHSAGALEIRNAADTALAALRVLSLDVGDGTTAGESVHKELAANGTDYISWLAPDSIAATLRLRFPDANPAGSILSFATPSGGIAQGSWVKLTRMCEVHIWGTGASNVLQDTDDELASCFNGFGVTETITAVRCWANAGTPTVTPIITGGAANSILTGALTCGTASFAAGTLNGTPTLAPGGSIDANITTAGGVATNIRLVFTLTR